MQKQTYVSETNTCFQRRKQLHKNKYYSYFILSNNAFILGGNSKWYRVFQGEGPKWGMVLRSSIFKIMTAPTKKY